MPNPYEPAPQVTLRHPEWSKNAVIYQINTRHFTPQGTFQAAQAHLPRLKDLGVDIIWLMPVQPIGVVNRKGSLGSPYSVRDYYAVNPEFGDLADLQAFVRAAHDLGMFVILDWVANHTAWDNPLTNTHPEWYARDWKGDFHPTPWWDWEDVIDLDFSQPALRQYMIEALKYWVREVDIDGYRCDVAGFVPTDFWEQARRALDEVKPVFMLAEWEDRDLHRAAFDMTYAWKWHGAVYDICKGAATVNALYIYYSWNEKAYPADIMRMLFVSNHDLNAWDGTEFERFGAGLEAAIVLSVVSEGMPLIYNGQEAGNPRRLAFFEKDVIDWRPHPLGDLYKKMFALKKANSALWNAGWGARMIRVPNSALTEVFSFVRQNAANKVFAVFNFTGAPKTVTFYEALYPGAYTEFFSGRQMTLEPHTQLTLKPWEYRLFIQ